MDYQRPDISPPNHAADDIVYCPSCSGFVISVDASEWSQFALGQLVALGVATFILTLVALALSLWSIG